MSARNAADTQGEQQQVHIGRHQKIDDLAMSELVPSGKQGKATKLVLSRQRTGGKKQKVAPKDSDTFETVPVGHALKAAAVVQAIHTVQLNIAVPLPIVYIEPFNT